MEDLEMTRKGMETVTASESILSSINSSADEGLQPCFDFSEDGQILHCTGPFIDEVGMFVARTNLGKANTSHRFKSGAVEEHDFNGTRLSLARELMDNTKYNFSDGPFTMVRSSTTDIQMVSDSQRDLGEDVKSATAASEYN